jgi:spermidine synthase
MRSLFVFFFVSGFCSVLYELVWLRLSMAQFGVTTAMVSIVLSTFMAGLGLGSWGSGYLLRKFEKYLKAPALRIYAATEFLIGISAIIVPSELSWGRGLLERWSLSSSSSYYLVFGSWVALCLVPWCACMGATIPIAMLCIRRAEPKDSARSFSYLYLANVLGAMVGSIIPLFLIELFGFHGTLRVAAVFNFLLAASAFALSMRLQDATDSIDSSGSSSDHPVRSARSMKPLILLFTTGLTSMGMEVVWIRLYTPYLGTVVYAFAEILCSYLAATFLGSRLYRQWSQKTDPPPILNWTWVLLGVSALLPLLTAGAGFSTNGWQRIWFGLTPFCSILGFVTPMLVDRWSEGDPDRAGRAYAMNVIGCILGPLLAGFFLLPLIGERWALLALAAPWLLVSLYPQWPVHENVTRQQLRTRQGVAAVALALGLTIFISSKDYAERFAPHVTLRDNTATIIATGEGMQRLLLVNGIGITQLSPITKMMAHLPLAFLPHPPRNALVICFGMGTTYRSVLSWGIPGTAVELVPSVPKVFGYFHPDGPRLLSSPLAHVVIDDGRRYLERTSDQYDIITIDPPPPVEAASSSLLYSEEFYAAIKLRLRPDGILQTWLPQADATVRSSAAQALKASFPYVRVYGSLEGWGNHFLASEQPLPDWTPQQLVAHMPPNAIADMMEWGPKSAPAQQFAAVLNTEFPIDQMIAEAPDAPPLEDDRPVNEYYVLRSLFPSMTQHSGSRLFHASR